MLAERLVPRNIIVDEFNIVDFNFSPVFNDAIEAKQKAEQDALKAQRDLERIKIEAEQKITEAQAEAESQRLQRETITDSLLQLRAIEKMGRRAAAGDKRGGSVHRPEVDRQQLERGSARLQPLRVAARPSASGPSRRFAAPDGPASMLAVGLPSAPIARSGSVHLTGMHRHVRAICRWQRDFVPPCRSNHRKSTRVLVMALDLASHREDQPHHWPAWASLRLGRLRLLAASESRRAAETVPSPQARVLPDDRLRRYGFRFPQGAQRVATHNLAHVLSAETACCEGLDQVGRLADVLQAQREFQPHAVEV